jgi:hypothetical protein
MNLRPCLHCAHRPGCERHSTMLARLRGSGVTLASFRCDDRLKGFEAGNRVSVTIMHAEETLDEYSYTTNRYGEMEFVGTILGRAKKAGKLVVWLDDISGTDVKKQAVCLHPDRLTLLGETVPLCRSVACGRPMTAKPDCMWYGFGCDDREHLALHPIPATEAGMSEAGKGER